MNLDQLLKKEIQDAVSALFGQSVESLQLQPTNQEFEGTHTLVCFPLVKLSRKNPEETAKAVGTWLVENGAQVERYNVVKGFLNLVLKDRVWLAAFSGIFGNPQFGELAPNGQEIMIEYSSPNTNK